MKLVELWPQSLDLSNKCCLSTSPAGSSDKGTLKKTAPYKPPDNSNTSIDYIPSEPGIALTEAKVSDFLSLKLDTILLDELYNHL